MFKQSGSCENRVRHVINIVLYGQMMAVYRKKLILCMFDQVLDILTELGGFPHELHEVHHQFALPPLPVYRSLRFAWNAAVWWKVRT